MTYILKQFDVAQEMVDYLNDVAVGSPISVGKIYGLNGLTFIINNGVDRTTTFIDTDEVGLDINEIIAQIEATDGSLVGGVKRRFYRPTTPPKCHLVIDTATWVIKGTGTANAKLGFPASDITVGAGAVPSANIVNVTTDEGGNKFTVIHE